MKQKKITNQDGKIKRTVKKYAPTILGALTSWMPVQLSQAIPDSNKKWNNAALEVTQNDTYNQLALAKKGSAKAYNESIAQVSIDTESGTYANPAAVATGNNYYGQHQLGITQNAGYNVQKYIAYALVYASPEFRESLSKNLLNGNPSTKTQLIEAFAASEEKYQALNCPEKAYTFQNNAFQKLFSIINVTPVGFRKAHTNFPEEGKKLQSRFVYEIYLNQMTHSLKKITEQNPQVQFETIHPSVIASVIAIAIKQGNGSRFEKAIHSASYQYYQQKALSLWENDNSSLRSKEAPLAVACRKGALKPDNVIVLGDEILRIYDEDNKGINEKDIITAPGYKIMVIKGKRPTTVHKTSEVVTFDTKIDKIDIRGIVNTQEWLKNYCRKFSSVYKKASQLLNKIPTIDTYYEIAIIFNNPNLYNTLEQFYEKVNNPENTAFFENGGKELNQTQKRLATDFRKLENLYQSTPTNPPATMTNTLVEKHRQNTQSQDKAEIIQKIMQNKFQRS